MSLFSKVVGGAVKLIPGLSQVFPQSSKLKTAAGTLSTVGNVLSGLGLGAGLGSALTSVTGPALPGGLASAGLSLGALPKAGTALAPIAAAGRALVPIARGLQRRYGKKAMAALNLFAVGSIVYDAATGQPVGTRYTRKINPLNHRELRFAIRRVKASARIARDMQKILGKDALARLGRC